MSKRISVGIRACLTTEANDKFLFDENTLVRIYALHELHRLRQSGLSRGALIDFHTRYKLVLLAHSQPEYRELGPLLPQSTNGQASMLFIRSTVCG